MSSGVGGLRARLLERLTPEEVETLGARDALSVEHADKLRENVLGGSCTCRSGSSTG